ncbi:hypothetical protein [Bosea sp. MMO-172]|uniref:hypothetical protein n=1 Tax=Bosea sp. MMO-172 TaxID=3127885 RepID=UPI003017EE02
MAAAVANQALKTGVDIATSYFGRRSDNAYSAVRCVVMLERYVQQAEAHLTETEIAFSREQTLESLPVPDPLPADINWKNFDTALSFRVLSFAAEVELAQAACDLEERETGYWIGNTEAKRLGLAAWALAVSIRKQYGLGPNHELAKLIPMLDDRDMEQARRRGKLVAERGLRRRATPPPVSD